jgi:signal transduction histidine kinase
MFTIKRNQCSRSTGTRKQRPLAGLDTMGGMIEAVLNFERDDTKHESRSLIDLSALVEGICQDAADAGGPVTFSKPRAVTISCRPTAMLRAISNLVDNAIKCGPDLNRRTVCVERSDC